MISFWGLLICAVVLEGTADLLFRKWGIARHAGAGSWMFFLMSLGIYMSGAVLWGLSLQFQAVSRGIIAFMVLNVLIVAVAGALLFGERLSVINGVGIVLGACSLVLVEWQ